MPTRRRRRRNQWFPVLGTFQEDSEQDTGGILFDVEIPITGIGTGGPTGLIPLIPDFKPDDAENDDTLSDFIGQDYIIERIVGKIHAHVLQTQADTPGATVFAAGFFVARTDNNGASPIGISAEANTNYGPLHPSNSRNPWLWRRTWAMANLDSTTPGLSTFALPGNNYLGSVMDGPHIDIKSKRRVAQEERLFLALQNMPLAGADAEGSVRGYCEIRVLGRLVKARNRGAF